MSRKPNSTTTAVPRAAKLLTVDVGAELKSRWLQWCRDRELVPSKALKHLIECALLRANLVADEGPEASQPCRVGGAAPPFRVGTRPDPRTLRTSRPYTTPYTNRPRVTRFGRQPKIEMRVSFTVSEHDAMVACATAEGFALQEFVIAAVRAALTHSPTFGQVELEALTRSNAVLAQAVSALRVASHEVRDTTLAERMRTLEIDLRAHIEQVSQYMAMGTRRWQIKI